MIEEYKIIKATDGYKPSVDDQMNDLSIDGWKFLAVIPGWDMWNSTRIIMVRKKVWGPGG